MVGFVDEQLDLYNAAAVCAEGEVRGVYHKQELPNYGVFDEQRYFAPGGGATQLFGIGGVRVGVSICEDAWNPQGPIAAQAAAGAELVININASPYYLDRLVERSRCWPPAPPTPAAAWSTSTAWGAGRAGLRRGFAGVRRRRAAGGIACRSSRSRSPSSISTCGRSTASGCSTLGATTAAPLPRHRGDRRAPPGPATRRGCARRGPRDLPLEAEVYQALVTGTGDYVRKNGFADVVIGLSGGIDSSLVAVVAADALGARARARRRHAVAILERGLRRPTRSRWPPTSASTIADDPDRAGPCRVPRPAGPELRRSGART